ncbi:MAG: TerC family protein [Ancalomicrobiaceae bacterium]|nr:TerC family protein [Ancalomicrobiaceae bacterium]
MLTDAFATEGFADLVALAKVVFIDVVLAGDNAVVVGMAAAGVPHALRGRVIFWGIAGAVVLRIILAICATHLLALIGLTFAGGILLLWVCWKMYREIREVRVLVQRIASGPQPLPCVEMAPKSFRQAIIQIVVADVSMSLDNVLAVAGAAREHIAVLVLGLILSVGLMGSAASVIANVLHRYRWLMKVGLLVVFVVAMEMIWRGSQEIACSGFGSTMCRHGLIDYHAVKAMLG